MLICCKMEVRTVECFVKFGKSGLETPETHHETAAIAPPFRHLGNKNAGNQACTRRKYTTILPFSHHILPFLHRIFTANKHRNHLNNTYKPPQPRQNMQQSIMKPPNTAYILLFSHRIFAVTHLVTAVLSVVFIVFERG